jgi:CheY-like chemotaxis protein/two-component sensor histidine kinase
MTQPSYKPSSDVPLRADMPDATAGGFGSERQLDALGRVASVVAHELTNLLQILSSSLDRLPSSDDPEGSMKVVRASIDRGTRLARQLQTFAQTAPPRLAQREIHQLMAAWMPEFEDALGPEQRLELRLRYRGTVVIDSDQLQTALVNLLANARDASEMNAPIVLELSRTERNGVAGCRIAVIDHGEGMTDDVARQAVAPFFTTRQPGKGMGLGLTIARMVAESHGGALDIDSAFGRGTTVSIYLPNAEARYAAEAASNLAHGITPHAPAHVPPAGSGSQASQAHGNPWAEAPPPRQGEVKVNGLAGHSKPHPQAHTVPVPQSAPPFGSAPPAGATHGGPYGGTHGVGPHGVGPHGAGSAAGSHMPAAAPHTPCVLVVDDEEAIAEYFRIILSAEHYDVQVVTSAHQALDRFAEDPTRYDTVLLDMMLRDGSGIDLYRKFRHLRPDLPVVVCTGFSDNESLAPIRADGHDILFKPCPRGDVLKAVGRAIQRAAARRPATSS